MAERRDQARRRQRRGDETPGDERQKAWFQILSPLTAVILLAFFIALMILIYFVAR